jgi:hypothetical protein
MHSSSTNENVNDLNIYITIIIDYVPIYTTTTITTNTTCTAVGSRFSIFGIATGYWLDDRGVGFRVSVGSRTFSSRRRPDRRWGPTNLLSNGYRGLFPHG